AVRGVRAEARAALTDGWDGPEHEPLRGDAADCVLKRELAQLDEGKVTGRAREVLLVGERVERASERRHRWIPRELLERLLLGFHAESLIERVDAERELLVVAELELRLDDIGRLGEGIGERRLRLLQDRQIVAELWKPSIGRLGARTIRDGFTRRG